MIEIFWPSALAGILSALVVGVIIGGSIWGRK